METNTIRKIRDLHGKIGTSLLAYQSCHEGKGTDMTAYTCGSEQEYSINGIIAGIKDILTDIAYLCENHEMFLQISSHADRNNLYNILNGLNNALIKMVDAPIVAQLETLKTKLLPYNVRFDNGRLAEFNKEIDNLRNLASSLEEGINAVKKKLSDSTTAHEKITSAQQESEKTLEELTTKKAEFIQTLNVFTSEHTDFQGLTTRATANEKTISDILAEVKQKKETFDGFIEKIDNNEKTLIKQAKDAEDFESQLTSYTNEQKNKLSEAQKLIDEARKALNYKTAEGLSAAFSTQHDSENRWWKTLMWIFGAIFFIGVSLYIGARIVNGWDISYESTHQMWFILIGRLCMIPLTVAAAVFCANQYTKQKNIIEDYAYKMTVAKSIITFSEELRDKDHERYAEYISTVLREIHQDPLRKRERDAKDVVINKETADLIKRIIPLIFTAIQYEHPLQKK